jgi:predicted ATP-binding protein involved in virulence
MNNLIKKGNINIMQLTQVEIIKYKNFNNIVIDFKKSNFPNVFSIASENGGGKSTLLQFIFIILHCFLDEKKKKYINNILENQIHYEESSVIKFIINHNDTNYNIDFFTTSTNWKNYDFNLYLDLEELDKEIKYNRDKEVKYNKILSLKKILEQFKRITPLFKNKFRESELIFNSLGLESQYNELRIDSNQKKVLNNYLNFINIALNKSEIQFTDTKELEEVYSNNKNMLEELKEKLNQEDIQYINHLNDKQVLLLKTDMSSELLLELSNRVFLIAPSSQLFHFLQQEDKLEIFDSMVSYSSVLENIKENLNNFNTYDFASIENILQSFKKASQEDLKQKRKTGNYGNRYDELTIELKTLLGDKEVLETEDGDRVIFKSKDTGEELYPEDLSHGELRKLGIYIWLKYIVDENSIILMDEPDIALHPKWQYNLVHDLVKWSSGTQFILATHSPQILSSTYYKNIIKLDAEGVKQYNRPPLDRDINTIITQIMEAPDFPLELLLLHKRYRKFINDGKVESREAKELKEEILEYESENSSFFQEINFDLELML